MQGKRGTYRVGQRAMDNAIKRYGLDKVRSIQPTGTTGFSTQPIQTNPLSKYEDQSYYNNMGNVYDAMGETQKRAGKDREQALGELRSGKTASLSEYANVPQDMITEEARQAMYNEGREVAEAERAGMLRQLQRQSGGMPSGAAAEAASQVDQAKMGTLAQLKRKIGTEASEKNWQSRFERAGALSGIHQGTAERLASVLGNTIAAVPKYENPVKSMEAAQKTWQEQNAANKAPQYNITSSTNYSDFLSRYPDANIDYPTFMDMRRKATGGTISRTRRI